ncbi:MAG: ABC transporter substrate-binding protein [Geminicoccaceae bacterium]
MRTDRRQELPIQLVQAEPLLPAEPCRRVASVHLQTRTLSQGIPQEICRRSRPAGACHRRQCPRLGPAFPAPRPDEQVRQSGSSDASTLDAHDSLPAERFVAERNPHFHRVDTKGQQLPYIDRIVMEVVDNKLVPVKTGAGETDLQSRGLSFQDFTFLKENEERSGLKVNLWKEARGAHLALYPNLNAADPVWRELFRDHRFREALSIALDRMAISQYLYFGLATPSNNTILAESPLHTAEIGEACLGYDVDRANALLDEIGLSKRNDEGLRQLADGRSLEFIVETAGEDSEQTDVLELVRDYWAALGIRIHTKPSEREVLRNRIFAGEALMSIWYGLENGVPTAEMSPKEFVPVNQYDQPQWPKWGQYFETKGSAGEAPDLPEAQRLMELFGQWEAATDKDARKTAWNEILQIYSSQCYTIGLVANVLQPVASRMTLRNLPEEAVYNWEPHGQIGLYRPDTFWFAD